MIDFETGNSDGLSLWESEANRIKVMTLGALQEQIAKFAALEKNPPAPNTYDVKVDM